MQVIKTWPILIIPKDVFFMFFSRSNEPVQSRGYSQKGIEMCSFIVVEKLKAESLRSSKTDILTSCFSSQ